MAQATDLIAFGMPPQVATMCDTTVAIMTAQGSSFASATPITNLMDLIAVTATNSGNYTALPPVGTGTGALVSDIFILFNYTAGAVVVTAPTGYTLYGVAASTAGTTGVSCSALKVYQFWAVSPSTYMYTRSG